MLAADEEQPRAFRTQQPLVPVRGEEVHADATDVDGKDAQSLDGVQKHQRPVLVGQGHQGVQVHPPAAGVSNPTDGHDPRAPVAGVGQAIQIDLSPLDRHSAGFDAAPGQVHPRVLVRRKLVGQRHDVVALAPGKSFRHEVDARRRIGNQRDLLGRGADQLRRGPTHLLDAFLPLEPNRIAQLGGLSRPGLDRLAGRPRKRRGRRVVQVDETAGDGHLLTKTLQGRTQCVDKGIEGF